VKIAAIGTLADVVPLVGENRVIAKIGLELLSRGPHKVGLRSLLDVCGLSGKTIDSFHIAFMLAPRVNAAGRMSTPDIATRLLLASDEKLGEETFLSAGVIAIASCLLCSRKCLTKILVQEDAMEKTLDKGQFWDTFKNRAVVVTDLPPGRSRDLANRANEAEGRGDASLRTKAEYSALFDLLLDPGSAPAHAELTLLDENGHVTAAGQAVGDYLKGSKGKDEFFDQDMYMVHDTHWPQEHLQPAEPVESSGDTRLALWRTHPRDERSIPPPDDEGVLFAQETHVVLARR
jgi:hypothetical protein